LWSKKYAPLKNEKLVNVDTGVFFAGNFIVTVVRNTYIKNKTNKKKQAEAKEESKEKDNNSPSKKPKAVI